MTMKEGLDLRVRDPSESLCDNKSIGLGDPRATLRKSQIKANGSSS